MLQVQNWKRQRSCSFSHPQKSQILAHPHKFYSSTHLPPATLNTQSISSVGDISGSVVLVEDQINDNHMQVSPNKSSKDKFNWRVILLPKFQLFVWSIFLYTFASAIVYQVVPAFGKETGKSLTLHIYFLRTFELFNCMFVVVLLITSSVRNIFIFDKD